MAKQVTIGLVLQFPKPQLGKRMGSSHKYEGKTNKLHFHHIQCNMLHATWN